MAFWIRICNTDILHNTLPLDCTHRACLTGKWCSVTPPWYLYNSLTSDSQHATDGKANVHVFIWHVFFFMGLIHSALFPVFLNNNVWTHCNTKKSNNKEIIQNAQLKGTDEVRCKMLCSEKKKRSLWKWVNQLDWSPGTFTTENFASYQYSFWQKTLNKAFPGSAEDTCWSAKDHCVLYKTTTQHVYQNMNIVPGSYLRTSWHLLLGKKKHLV